MIIFWSPKTSGSCPTWTTLTASEIKRGSIQIQAGVTVTGTLNYPLAASGTAGTVDIATIKETVRFVLHENNTTTGAPVIDLSSGLQRRVQNIFTVNPEMIPILANNFPFVTVYCTKKNITPKTIATNQVQGKREAELTFSVVGATFLMFNNTSTADTAQADCEYLMENVERVLRSYVDLNASARWQFPTGVTYHAAQIDEQTHLRVGMMDLSCKVFY